MTYLMSKWIALGIYVFFQKDSIASMTLQFNGIYLSIEVTNLKGIRDVAWENKEHEWLLGLDYHL